jgi:hypothetical protein
LSHAQYPLPLGSEAYHVPLGLDAMFQNEGINEGRCGTATLLHAASSDSSLVYDILGLSIPDISMAGSEPWFRTRCCSPQTGATLANAGER